MNVVFWIAAVVIPAATVWGVAFLYWITRDRLEDLFGRRRDGR
jgi:hypothetical protein